MQIFLHRNQPCQKCDQQYKGQDCINRRVSHHRSNRIYPHNISIQLCFRHHEIIGPVFWWNIFNLTFIFIFKYFFRQIWGQDLQNSFLFGYFRSHHLINLDFTVFVKRDLNPKSIICKLGIFHFFPGISIRPVSIDYLSVCILHLVIHICNLPVKFLIKFRIIIIQKLYVIFVSGFFGIQYIAVPNKCLHKGLTRPVILCQTVLLLFCILIKSIIVS